MEVVLGYILDGSTGYNFAILHQYPITKIASNMMGYAQYTDQFGSVLC